MGGMGGVFTPANLAMYTYSHSSPVTYVDPDGNEIVSQNPKNNAKLLLYINSLTSATFVFDKENKLQLSKTDSAKGGSRFYANRLIQAINSKETITIAVTNELGSVKKTDPKTGKVMVERVTIDGVGGGGVTLSSKFDVHGPQVVGISGHTSKPVSDVSGKPMKLSPSEVLMHELVGHAIPHVVGGGTGNAIQNENIVRQELNKPLRGPDSVPHPE